MTEFSYWISQSLISREQATLSSTEEKDRRHPVLTATNLTRPLCSLIIMSTINWIASLFCFAPVEGTHKPVSLSLYFNANSLKTVSLLVLRRFALLYLSLYAVLVYIYNVYLSCYPALQGTWPSATSKISVWKSFGCLRKMYMLHMFAVTSNERPCRWHHHVLHKWDSFKTYCLVVTSISNPLMLKSDDSHQWCHGFETFS